MSALRQRFCCGIVFLIFLFVVFGSNQEDKPKQRKSRTRSKETPPLGQHNQALEWQTPKGRQAKPRQRKNKKTEASPDPEIEIQQQMYKQQIYRQMEQRHRLLQQKQGVFVEQGQQPIPQASAQVNQHITDNQSILSQQPPEVPLPVRTMSHTPELPQGPPSRPDSQVSVPPGTSVPQVPLPSNAQMPPVYPQGSEQGSFSQRFPTPEHYLKQFGQHAVQQRQPTVRYVAEANNPFSDKFQDLHKKGRGRGGARKKSGSRKPGRPPSTKATEAATSDDSLQSPVNSAVQESASSWPDCSSSPAGQGTPEEAPKPEEVVSESLQEQNETGNSSELVSSEGNEGKEERNDASVQEAITKSDLLSEPQTEVGSFGYSNEMSDGGAVRQPKLAVPGQESTIVSPAPVEQESKEQSGKELCNGTGLEALQKLEIMVADMANEEEACKELEKQTELERLQLPLDEDEFDPEMDKMYEGNFVDDTMFQQSSLSPTKAVNNRSQANSVVSLECHEESLISPLDMTEMKKDRPKFFAEALNNDSGSLERVCTEDGGQASAREQQDKEQASTTTALVSALAPCHAGNTDAAEPVLDVNNASHAESKVSSNDVLEEGTQSARQEANCMEVSEKQMLEELTSAKMSSKEQRETNEIKEPELFARPMLDNTEASKGSLGNADVALIGPAVGCSMQSGNDTFLAAQDVGNVPQAADVLGFGSSVHKEGSQSRPQQVVANVAGPMVENVIQTQEALNYHQPGQVQETTPATTLSSAQPVKPVKTAKQQIRSKNQQLLPEVGKKKAPPKEEDPQKKQLAELKRQEYERKKREYEEQQKKKRALQVKLRHEKQLIREQRKRQRIYMNANNRNKQKTEVRNSAPSLKIITSSIIHKEAKPSAPLSLCEPKLLLTLALTHPYGSRPFNGQCLLKGNFGSAKVDGVVDYYSQFLIPEEDLVSGHPPTPPSSLPPSPGVHQRKTDSSGKPLVNGDIAIAQRERAEPLALSKTHDTEFPSKRARYMSGLDCARGNISVPPSMPTPPLTDTTATANDRLSAKQSSDTRADTNGRESNSHSLSSSPETVQYIASSSPESDAVSRLHTPKFVALLHRDITDSPTFPSVAVKREKVEHLSENGVSRSCAESCSGVSDTQLLQTNCKLEAYNLASVGNDSDDLDSIHVTLTLSPTSEQRVTDTVASVADLIGCSPPRRSDIIIEPTCKPVVCTGYPLAMTGRTGDKPSVSIAPVAHTSTDIYQKSPFPCSQLGPSSSEESASRTKPEGPYCRHCDVLIIGIGVKRKPEDEEMVENPPGVESDETDTCSADYKIYRVNVEVGDCTGDIFCSDACLKQYFSHVGSDGMSLTQELKPDVSSVQPAVVSSLVSEGQTSLGAGNATSVGEIGARGCFMAEGLPPTSFRKIRSPSWKDEDQHDEVSNRFDLTHGL